MYQRLLKARQEARGNEGGFTLIELLIVIVVLGILAGIVVLGLGTFKKDSAQAACKADAKQVQTASDAYYASPSLGNSTTYAATIQAMVDANLLKSLPNATSLAKISYDSTTGDVTETCDTIA